MVGLMKTCYWCEESILDNEISVPVGELFAHEDCNMRSIVGSVAHIEKRCSCFVSGSTQGDPEGMTRKEAAHAARIAFAIRRDKMLGECNERKRIRTDR